MEDLKSYANKLNIQMYDILESEFELNHKFILYFDQKNDIYTFIGHLIKNNINNKEVVWKDTTQNFGYYTDDNFVYILNKTIYRVSGLYSFSIDIKIGADCNIYYKNETSEKWDKLSKYNNNFILGIINKNMLNLIDMIVND